MNDTETDDVCPACAGMIRSSGTADADAGSLPRMRGDDPSSKLNLPLFMAFAPHARG